MITKIIEQLIKLLSDPLMIEYINKSISIPLYNYIKYYTIPYLYIIFSLYLIIIVLLIFIIYKLYV